MAKLRWQNDVNSRKTTEAGLVSGRAFLCLLLAMLANIIIARGQQGSTALLTLPNMPLHDPWMLANEADKTYYLYTSNVPKLSGVSVAGTMVYRSVDLKHWEPPVLVFRTSEMRWAQSGAWAPEVHRWKGKYYLFTTVFDDSKPLPPGRNAVRPAYRRGTISAVSDSPLGPFHPVNPDAPLPPSDFMTLDGTLYVDPVGKPWLVYAHEWLQKTDGTIEAVQLTDDLAKSAAPPIFLFKASDAPWLDKDVVPSTESSQYVTDGPELFRTHDGHLLMLWSSYSNDSKYIQTIARSKTGAINGPWEQLAPLVYEDSGHGMLFHAFDGQLMMILHRPFKNARGKVYDMQDAGDHLEIVRERTDLDAP
ncbi:glycoside hydrolase family 43 protein [Granulicella aggregans]|uniref:glycoside hydrolase family 43 protein n=1 Tax=Granulicella aggregans TaxID=474949 RepID=UPI0021DFBCD0|nr:glycoside hydrolase family 43 protein [Granulicella aggregans]